ncbi:MAG: FecR domain-containing protein [Myxococcaceae bacterium]|nr:FecR domain-containing protein [Myxococcaceae bacterium]
MTHKLPDDLPGRLLGSKHASARPVPPPPDALVAAVRARLERGRRLRSLWRIAGVAVAAGVATAGIYLGVGAARGEHPGARVSSASGVAVLTPQGSQAVAVTPGMPVSEGSWVVTHEGGAARIELASGSSLSLASSSQLQVVQLDAQQRFRLSGGRAAVHVQRLPASQRFVVATDDVEVEVRGTRFEVESTQVDAACDVATATRVVVLEGTVVVRRGADDVELVGPAHWPDCKRVDAVEPPPAAEPHVVEKVGRAPRRAVAELAELNARYRAALVAKRRGDAKSALAQFEDFYRTYPNSQLAEAARVEALRLLGRTDAGKAAAADYLARYPSGFARDEARAMLGP